MRVSQQSALALEWPTVLALVARVAATDVGRRQIEALEPVADGAVVRARLERGREVAEMLEDGELVPSFEVEILPVFSRLDESPLDLEGSDLLVLGDLLRGTREACERISAADPARPALAALIADLPDLDHLRDRYESVLDRRGRVRDDASPRLAELRRRAQKVRQRIYDGLEGYVDRRGDEGGDGTVTLHDERLVVLVPAGSQRPAGLVHGRSGSGQSLYFEPLEVVAPNNELTEVHAEEEAERQRLLRELITMSRAELEALTAHLELIAELDVRQAAARWGRLVGGAWIAPEEGRECRIREARHPLLDPRVSELRAAVLGSAGHAGEVVPLDLELGRDTRVLVVTGPNAGGKTVALKTLGLLVLAAHAGLPVPMAPDSSLPLLSGLVGVVGDEQDLLADRSTFSGRLLRLKEAWEEAGPGVLVLLDELGSGTDPEEGAALAIALLEGLLERRSLAVASSHLVRVALAALELDGAGCAAMAFDPASGLPTYRLVAGTPGASEALALARRLRLPRRWLDRASRLLGAEHGSVQRLLAEVEATRDELVRSEKRAAAEAQSLAGERRRLEEERAKLEAERRSAAADARRTVGEFRRETRERLRAEVRRLEEAFAGGRRRGLAAEADERLFASAPFADVGAESGPIAVGERVRHRAMGWEGKLIELEDDRAQVIVGGKRLRCAADELAPAASGEPEKRARTRVSIVRSDGPDLPSELDLRGERVDAALERLARHLDQALLESGSAVRVVHGHGTGRLKKAVRELLDRHEAVAKWRPGRAGEGGDGATIVMLTG